MIRSLRTSYDAYPDGNPTNNVFHRSISSGTTANGGCHSHSPPPRLILRSRRCLALSINWFWTNPPRRELSSSSTTRMARTASTVRAPVVMAFLTLGEKGIVYCTLISDVMNGLQFVFYESIGLHTKTNEMMIQCIISNITAAVPRLLMIKCLHSHWGHF